MIIMEIYVLFLPQSASTDIIASLCVYPWYQNWYHGEPISGTAVQQ